MKMKSLYRSPFVASLILALSFSAGNAAGATEEQVFKVGITGPLTGPQAAIGKDDENGARMALDKVNAQGIVADGKKVRFELVSVDDAADPRTGMTVAQ